MLHVGFPKLGCHWEPEEYVGVELHNEVLGSKSRLFKFFRACKELEIGGISSVVAAILPQDSFAMILRKLQCKRVVRKEIQKLCRAPFRAPLRCNHLPLIIVLL